MYVGSQFGRPQPLFAWAIAFRPKEKKDNMPVGPRALRRLLTSWQLGGRERQKWAPAGPTSHRKAQSPTTIIWTYSLPSSFSAWNRWLRQVSWERWTQLNPATGIGRDSGPWRMQRRNDYSHKRDEGRDHNPSCRKVAGHTASSPEVRSSRSL